MAIRAQKGDAIAGLDSRSLQRASQAAGSVCELSVSKAIFSAHDRRLTSKLLRGVAQEANGCEGNIHGFSWLGSLSSVDGQDLAGNIVGSVRRKKHGRPFQV